MYVGGNPGIRRTGSSSVVSVSNMIPPVETGLAKEATQSTRYGGETVPVVTTVSASGDTTIYTPTAGMCIELRWIYAIPDSSLVTTPVIKVKIGTTEYYRVYAVSHWERFKGAQNASLIINLSTIGTVQVTAHIKEVPP